MSDESRIDDAPQDGSRAYDELLRRAYGAGTSEIERAQAISALAQFPSIEGKASAESDAAPDRLGFDAEARGGRDQRAGSPAHGVLLERTQSPWMHRARAHAPALAIALVIGTLVGSTVGRFQQAATPAATESAPSERGAVQYFLEPDGRAGVVAPLDTDDPLRQATLDVLWSEPGSNVRVYTGLTESDAVCLIGVASSARAQTCTSGPALPDDGLTVELPVENAFGELRITLLPGGSLRIDDGFEVHVVP